MDRKVALLLLLLASSMRAEQNPHVYLPFVPIPANDSTITCPPGSVNYRPKLWKEPQFCLPKELNLAMPISDTLENYCESRETWWEYASASIVSVVLVLLLVCSCCLCCRVSRLNDKLHVFVPGHERHGSCLGRFFRRLFRRPEPGNWQQAYQVGKDRVIMQQPLLTANENGTRQQSVIGPQNSARQQGVNSSQNSARQQSVNSSQNNAGPRAENGHLPPVLPPTDPLFDHPAVQPLV